MPLAAGGQLTTPGAEGKQLTNRGRGRRQFVLGRERDD